MTEIRVVSAAGDDDGNAWPVEIRVFRGDRRLEVQFDDGVSYDLPAELLRVESPSAEVQGHGPSQKQTVAGKRSVGITGVEAVGNYAVRIRFDDGHDTGIYSWGYLRELGRNRDHLWTSYLQRLEERGLSRG